jgi:hypothetical protein
MSSQPRACSRADDRTQELDRAKMAMFQAQLAAERVHGRARAVVRVGAVLYMRSMY